MLVRLGYIRGDGGGRRKLRTLGFRAARGLLYRALIPLLMRSGPLEPLALRIFRRLSYDRPARMEGLPCPVRLGGLTLWYDANRPSNTIRGLAAGDYEQPIADLLADTLRPGMTALDVGAHIGYFSLVAGAHVGPTGRVWSFEPDPANRASLECNIEANGMRERVSVVPLAVSSTVGESSLYQMASDTGSSTLFPGAEMKDKRIAVGTTSLDAWAESESWPTIDLLKVDAEGAEGAVLAGMKELVERNPNIVVVLEFQADALEAAGEEPIGFLRQATATGHVEVLDDRGNRTVDPDHGLARLTRRSRWSPLNLAIRNLTPPGNPKL